MEAVSETQIGHRVKAARPGPLRLLYVVNTDWYFVSHRLAHARAAQDEGYEVHVASPDTGYAEDIRAVGIEHHKIEIRRGGVQPCAEAKTVRDIERLLAAMRPHVLHLVAARASLLGGLAGLMHPRIRVVYTIAGQGYEGDSGKVSRRARHLGLKLVLHRWRSCTVFQTETDRQAYLDMGLLRPRNARLIQGVGVDPMEWHVERRLGGEPTVVFASRLFREKGIEDFVEAIKLLRQAVPNVRAYVAGANEVELATGVSRDSIGQWERDGIITYLGHIRDIRPMLATAHVLALPTYHREGVPKILLEAAAAGVPLVTTDLPGCQAVVRDGVTGLTVPPRSPVALAAALQRLLEAPQFAAALASAARAHVSAHFSLDQAATATLRLYRELGVEPAPAHTGEGWKGV